MPAGRPSKLTPEVQETICRAIRRGCYIETAAALGGIHKDTFYEWLKRGNRQSKGKYREFSDAVKKALAEAESRELKIIDKAAQGYTVVKTKRVEHPDGKVEETHEESHRFNWQAAAWKLERCFPDRWTRRLTVSSGDEDQNEQPTELVREMDALTFPPGPEPAEAEPGEVSGDTGGPAEREDGTREAEAGPKPAD